MKCTHAKSGNELHITMRTNRAAVEEKNTSSFAAGNTLQFSISQNRFIADCSRQSEKLIPLHSRFGFFMQKIGNNDIAVCRTKHKIVSITLNTGWYAAFSLVTLRETRQSIMLLRGTNDMTSNERRISAQLLARYNRNSYGISQWHCLNASRCCHSSRSVHTPRPFLS